MTFRYPFELNPDVVDYVIFRPHKYVTNMSGTSGNPTGAPVTLYMPTTTPTLDNNNKWGEKTFAGPMGRIIRQGLSDITQAIDETDGSDFQSKEAAESLAKSHIDKLKSTMNEVGDSGGGALKQAGLEAIGQQFDMNANQLMAMSTGKSFNPNVELLYEGPTLRGFNFQYTFAPKSAEEAQEVADIIKHFKIHHSPADTGNGMYQIPDVFQVTYMSGGDYNRFMPQFKRAALTDIQVQANPGLPMYMAFENGCPIVTAMSLTFTEVDVITRDDHQSSYSYIGY